MTKEELQKAFNFKLIYDVPFTDKADFYIYEESTADGYEVYIACKDPHNVLISEDVHYYDSDLGQVLADEIIFAKAKWSNLTIYVENIDATYVQDAMDLLEAELEVTND